MLQSILKGRGGTIETYFLDRQPASCVVNVYNGSGGLMVDSASCTVDTTSTTATTAARFEDDTITLASVTGIVPGRRYLLGGDTPEEVSVRSISGLTVQLWAPLANDHVVGATFKGLRVSYTVQAANAGSLWWDGYADFSPDTGDVQTEAVDCVRRKIPDVLISESDIQQIIPQDIKALSAELDVPRAFREAREQMLLDFGGKNRAQTILGADYFRRPCALKFWLMRRFEFGPEWKDQMDILAKEYEDLIERLISQAPVDADQDGTTNGPNDGGFTVITLERA